MKLCKDCEAYIDGASAEEDRCRNVWRQEDAEPPDLVRGEPRKEPVKEYVRCVEARMGYGDAAFCGREAKLYKAKP